MFSGWYNHVAIRQLKGVSSETRSKMYRKLLQLKREVQGRPYETNNLELL